MLTSRLSCAFVRHLPQASHGAYLRRRLRPLRRLFQSPFPRQTLNCPWCQGPTYRSLQDFELASQKCASFLLRHSLFASKPGADVNKDPGGMYRITTGFMLYDIPRLAVSQACSVKRWRCRTLFTCICSTTTVIRNIQRQSSYVHRTWDDPEIPPW